jgi:fibronectin-binding autotransporter adhesin
MKKLLFLLLAFPALIFAQTTLVVDPNNLPSYPVGSNNIPISVDSAGRMIANGGGGGGGGVTSIIAGSGISIDQSTGAVTITATASGGSVTSVSVVTANGVSGSVATATTTPAITLTLGAITPSSISIGADPADAGDIRLVNAGIIGWEASPAGTDVTLTVNSSEQFVFSNAILSPTLITPALGTPASGVVTNLTGTASININGTVGATTPTTGAFTTVNGNTITTGTGTLTLAASSSLITSGAFALTLTSTATTNATFPAGTSTLFSTTTKGDALQAALFAADAGSTDAYAITLAPALTGYTTGTTFWFKANTLNTGAATLNVNGLGAKTIKKASGGITTDLATNDILAGQWVLVTYDGTNFQMQSTLGNAPSGSGTVASGTINVLAKYTATGTAVGNSLATDDGTTLTYTGTGGLSVASGSTAGAIALTQGTTQSTGTTNIVLQAPAAVTSYIRTLPGAVGSTGFLLETVSGSVQTESLVGFTGTNTVVRDTTPTITTPVFAGGNTASGSGANTWVGSSGTFITSTGANTLSGAVTVNGATTPSITLASGKTNTGFFQVNGKTSGSLKIIAADAAAQAVTITLAAQTTGSSALTLPDMAGAAGTFAFINKAQTWTGIQSLTSPDFTTSITTTSTSFTALAGATTLLTLGGTGASASTFMPSTLDASSSTTGAIRTSGGISAAKSLNIGTTITGGGALSIGTSNAATVGTIELGASADTTISRSVAGVIAVEGNIVSMVGPRITAITSSATPTFDVRTCDIVNITAQAADITSMTTNMTNTGVLDGQQLEFRILGTAARAITWGANFASGIATLPTTTTTTKTLYVYCEYDSVQAKWMCQSTGSYP